MALYSASDTVNRYITYKVAHNLAADLKEGNKRALDFAERALSEGGKSSLRRLIATGREEEVGNELARYLIGKTQFNYGKESMNEFGREHGRLFSMFTKWPAMIMSDSSDLLDQYGKLDGSKKIAQRYLAPMALLAGVGSLVVDKNNPNHAVTYLLGEDLSDIAPAQSFKVGAGPVVKTGMNAAKTLLDMFSNDLSVDQKIESVRKLGSTTALSYLPGMAPVNEYIRWKRAFHPGE
jgi:hypothetical protein